MIRAVLFDLDDTLLGNDMAVLLPEYFKALSRHMAAHVDPVRFLDALLSASRQMMTSTDLTLTNGQVFWRHFEADLGIPRSKLDARITSYYIDEYPKLQHLTQLRSSARSTIEWCQARNLPIVVATNPVFPLVAIEERLKWAGLPVIDFQFELVTSYEVMHSTKPHRAYYEEIASRLGLAPSHIAMVGNDAKQDIVPAASCEMQTFFIGTSLPSELKADGHGELSEVVSWLDSRVVP